LKKLFSGAASKGLFRKYGSRSPLYLCPRSFASTEDATAIGAKGQQCEFLLVITNR